MKSITKSLSIFPICIAVLNLNLVNAQPRFHDNLEAEVGVSVSDTSVQGFIYRYQISNNVKSGQNIEEIAIEIGDLSKKKGGSISEITQIIEKIENGWAILLD